VRRLAVAADDVCTTADRAYRYVPRGGFVHSMVCPRYHCVEFQAVVFSVWHLDAPVDQLGSRVVDNVVVYGGRRSIHDRACRVWPLSHLGSEGRSSGR